MAAIVMSECDFQKIGKHKPYLSSWSPPFPLLAATTVVTVWPEVMGLMGALTKRRDSCRVN